MIDVKTYLLGEENYYNKIYDKTQIVIGHTSRGGMEHFKSWVNRRNGRNKRTAHYTIDEKGKIYQHFNPLHYSDFIGHEQDKGNISITLSNVGWLKLNEVNKSYTDWLGHIYSKDSDVIYNHWRNYAYWMKYSESQMDSLSKLLHFLCEEFGIKKKVYEGRAFNSDVDIFDGITFRCNYYRDLTDISPAFNIEKIKNI